MERLSRVIVHVDGAAYEELEIAQRTWSHPWTRGDSFPARVFLRNIKKNVDLKLNE